MGNRTVITVLTVITALVHLVVLNLTEFSLLFALNGLGYLALLWALFNPPAFLAGRSKLVHYAFMGYALVTIIAWVVLNGDFSDPIGVGTKIVEVLLIVALWQHMGQAQSA
jgi:hypothetical protein